MAEKWVVDVYPEEEEFCFFKKGKLPIVSFTDLCDLLNQYETLLKEWLDAEWMVSPDWSGAPDRQAFLAKTQTLLGLDENNEPFIKGEENG